MPELIGNPLKVVDSRYFVEGAETKWSELAIRVGSSIAMAESSETNRKKYSDIFTESIFNLEFIPGGRILRNAGRIKGSLFNCYVLPFGDSREEIGKYYSDSFVLWGEGGGIGTNLSSLRPEGAPIRGVGGKSSGPISFLKASDFIAETIQIGGQRRAAGLALMNVRHPDILKFINAKLVDKLIPHYNISVGVTEEFLQRVESNKMWDLKFAQKTYNTIDAKTLWDTLISNMLTSAEPGLINWDNLRENNSYFYAPVITTNPSLRKGTKLLTDNGIIPIEELQDKNFKIPNIKNAYSNATCFLSGVNKNLYKITLQGGHEIFATAEHKWPTVIKNKWNYELNDFIKKKTNKLNKGDYLPQPVKKTELGYGDKGSYNDGFLIGWNIGDGWISNNDRKEQIGFIVAKEDQKYDIHNILTKKLKELGWTGEFKNRNNNKETNISNNAVRKFFQNFGVTKKEFGIPKSIWNIASENFRKGFIDALFSSDGNVNKDGRITLVTAHKNLAYDISDLLGFYGIQSSIQHKVTKEGHFPNGKVYDKIYHRYNLVISRSSSVLQFSKVFKLTHKRKQVIIDTIVKNYKLIQPANVIKILSIEKTELYEDVWDVTVFDDIHCFELSQVVTGNCGEAILSPYETCFVGSIVLPKFVGKGGNTNWIKMQATIENSVRFLDDVIDCNNYILDIIKTKSFDSRRIGLGYMGLADYLFAKKLRYGSTKALEETEKLAKFVRNCVYESLVKLSSEKGSFPKFDSTAYSKAKFIRTLPPSLRMDIKKYGSRCVTGISIAPTGTISLIAGVSSGIEPLFLKAYERKDQISNRIYIHDLYKQALKDNTDDIDEWFVDTSDLKPEDHLEIQSIVQKYVDGGVSKTINFQEDISHEKLSSLLLEYIRDLKGVTIYVDGSREGQILNKISKKQIKKFLKKEQFDSDADIDTVKCSSGSCEL